MAEKIEIAKVQLGLDTSTFEQQFQNLMSKFPNDIMKLFDALNKYSGTKNIGESLFREPIQKAIEQSKKDYQNFAEFVADINRQITDQSLKFTYNTKAGRATIGGTGYKSSDLATITKEVVKVITAQKTKTTPADKKSTSNNADALNRTLTQTVDNLNTTVQNLNSASSSLNTSATNIGNSASALGTANANLGNTSQSISGASVALNTAAQAVSNAANALSGAAQNTGNPSTNSSTGGGNGSSSSIGNSASTFKGSIVHLDEFSVQTVKSMDLAAKTSQKATASVINAQRILEKFAGKYGDLLRNVSLIFGDTGDLQKINATLRLSAKESANISLTPSDIQNVMANPKKLELKDALLQSGGVSSLHRVYTDETTQIEVYKKLLKEQYALEQQIAEAHAKEDRFLENKLRYQLSYNRAQKDFLNQGRIAARRDILTNTYGDVKDTESIAYANKKYKEENERIIPIIKEREKNNALISEEENKIKELTSLLEKEMNLKTQISKLKPSSRKASDLNVDLQQTRQRIDELRVVSKSSSGTYGNRVNELVSRYRGSGSREEVNTYNELIRLEDERFETWKKYKTAKEKGNTQEASFYGQQIANLKKEYSELLDVAKATGTLNQEIEKQLNLHREYNKEQQRAITLRARDKKLQNEQTTNYSKATKSLQEYVELRREQGKLTNKAGKGDKGIYTAAYQNVQDKMSAITGTSGLGNLIDFSSGQMSLKSFNTTLGITREQYEKLRTVVAEANATIKDDTIKAKQESDLATLNKMITAYINLKKAQSTLQEYKARAYNDATVNQQQAVVDRLQAQYNALLKDNDALAKTSTYTNMVAEANAKMADNVTRSNQSNSKQLTLLERLKASFQRTAAVAFSFNIFNRLFMEMRQGLSNVIEKTKEFDKTMTEVQMVTNQTDTSVRKTLASYSELAKELGTTTDAVAKGNLEWLRQGKSAEDSAKLIRASTMMSTLGAMESSEATQKLTAWVRAGYIVIYIKINSFNCGKILRAYYTNL